jgi:hypothetical protein
MRMSEKDDDRSYMGTAAAARDALLEKARNWRRLRQPMMGTRSELRAADAEEHEARFQLANAALLWLWHEENPS